MIEDRYSTVEMIIKLVFHFPRKIALRQKIQKLNRRLMLMGINPG